MGRVGLHLYSLCYLYIVICFVSFNFFHEDIDMQCVCLQLLRLSVQYSSNYYAADLYYYCG